MTRWCTVNALKRKDPPPPPPNNTQPQATVRPIEDVPEEYRPREAPAAATPSRPLANQPPIAAAAGGEGGGGGGGWSGGGQGGGDHQQRAALGSRAALPEQQMIPRLGNSVTLQSDPRSMPSMQLGSREVANRAVMGGTADQYRNDPHNLVVHAGGTLMGGARGERGGGGASSDQFCAPPVSLRGDNIQADTVYASVSPMSTSIAYNLRGASAGGQGPGAGGGQGVVSSSPWRPVQEQAVLSAGESGAGAEGSGGWAGEGVPGQAFSM